MRILVTGAFGFVGKYLCNRLQNHEVLKFGRLNNLEEVIYFQPEIIFHLAATIQGALDEFINSNILLTHALLKLNVQFKQLKSFINIGSSSEYGRKQYPIKETDFLEPTNIYEATKAGATLLCQGYAKAFNLPIVTARPFTIYGPEESSKKLIPTIYDKWIKKETLNLYDGVHDFLYIDDFIDGLIMLSEQPKEKIQGDIINFGTGIPTINKEVLEVFESVVKDRLDTHFFSSHLRNYDSNHWVCDPTYAFKKYGWKAKTTLEEGMKKYVASRS